MGVNVKSFEGCRVVVSDKETREAITDTTIVSYDASRNVIRIQEDLFQKDKDFDKVNVLILGNQGLYEFAGTLRKAVSSGETEIALYAGKEKESRGYLRYEMRARGRVAAVFVANQEIRLRRMIAVQIVNISASGIFFAATAGSFVAGEKIRLEVDLKGNVFTSDYEVVRLQKDDGGIWGYGCRNMVSGKDAQKQDVQVENEAENEEWAMEALKENASYEMLQETMEERSGYRALLEQVTKFITNISPSEEEREKFIQEILEKYKDMSQEVIFNCIYRERPKQETKSRHFLNVMLLIALLGDYLEQTFTDTFELLNSYIKIKLPDEKKEEVQKEQNTEENTEEQISEETEELLLFIDDYDNNIADYERNHTGIPLAFLVQMCYSDVSCKKRKPKTVFAENMLQNVMHRPVLLSDGTLCSLEYLLLNDLSHSIILENGIGKRMKDSIEPAWFIPQIRKEKAQTRQSTLEPEAEDTQELTETEQAADSAPTEDSALETAKAD